MSEEKNADKVVAKAQGPSVLMRQFDQLDDLIAGLPEGCQRRLCAEAARDVRSSWVKLGAKISEVLLGGDWRDWGFASVEEWVGHDLQMKLATAKRLAAAYEWVRTRHPDRLDKTLPAPEVVARLASAARKAGEDAAREVEAKVFGGASDKEARALVAGLGATREKPQRDPWKAALAEVECAISCCICLAGSDDRAESGAWNPKRAAELARTLRKEQDEFPQWGDVASAYDAIKAWRDFIEAAVGWLKRQEALGMDGAHGALGEAAMLVNQLLWDIKDEDDFESLLGQLTDVLWRAKGAANGRPNSGDSYALAITVRECLAGWRQWEDAHDAEAIADDCWDTLAHVSKWAVAAGEAEFLSRLRGRADQFLRSSCRACATGPKRAKRKIQKGEC